MRIFTKSVLTFLLLCVASVAGAQVFQVLDPNGERDYSKTDSYPYYRMGAPEGSSYDVIDGTLQIENTVEQGNNWDLQPFILDWFNPQASEEYIVKIWMKATGDGSANLSIGTWSKSDNASFDFVASDDYQLYQVKYISTVTTNGNDAHILFQSGKFVGTINILKVQIGQNKEVRPTLSKNWRITENKVQNGDAEGDDLSYFPVSWDGPNNGGTAPDSPEVVDGGNGGKCFKITTHTEPSETWHTQLYAFFKEASVPKGTKWKIKMDVKGDQAAKITTSAQALPRAWKGGTGLDDIPVTTSWTTFTGTITSPDDEFQSIAFDLSNGDEEVPNTAGDGTVKVNRGYVFYFDNIEIGPWADEMDVRYTKEGFFKILFPRYTNTIRLVNANADGRPRYILPNSCMKVTVNGEPAVIGTVELDISGDLYVFLDEEQEYNLSATDQVVVSFTNPADAKNHFIYIDEEGGDVENFSATATFDNSLSMLPDIYGQPYLMVAEPENKSFNLPTTQSEFTLTFDRDITAEGVEARLDREALAVEYVKDDLGDCKQIVLKRKTADALAEGDHTLTVTKVFSTTPMDDNDYATFELSYTIGGGISEELTQQIASAQEALTNAAGERYAGEAYNALDEAVTRIDGEYAGYTAPSVVGKALSELSEKTKALVSHKTACDDYDGACKNLYTLYSTFAGTALAGTDVYKQVAAAVAKYNMGMNEEEQIVFDVLYDDEQLAAAVADLKPVSDNAGNWLTMGQSDNNSTKGYAALHERIRRGVELLKTLGVAEDAPEIVAANAELGDNDEISAAIMKRATFEIYKDLASGESQLFTPSADADGNEITPSYDLSVFIKNPNAYGPAKSAEVPGWTATQGSVVAWSSWGDDSHNSLLPDYPQDCSIHAGWHPNGEKGAIVEQTIENLPAGIYNVQLRCWENGEKPEDTSIPTVGFSFGFAKTSDVLDPERDPETGELTEDFDPDLHTSGATTSTSTLIEGLEVIDGKLTIGYHYGNKSQAFLEDSWIYLVGASTTFPSYADAYQELLTNIDAATPAKTRAIELYDMNGRRISTARKGIVIVKKLMSDGSVNTQKVVK